MRWRRPRVVYNPGDHLLGASSPLYALALSPFMRLFDNPVTPAVYGWPFGLGTCAFLGYRLIGRGALGFLGACLLYAIQRYDPDYVVVRHPVPLPRPLDDLAAFACQKLPLRSS